MLSKFLLLSLAEATVMPASTSLLSVTFPHTEAGLPAIYLGGVLWAESAPIIVGAQGAHAVASRRRRVRRRRAQVAMLRVPTLGQQHHTSPVVLLCKLSWLSTMASLLLVSQYSFLRALFGTVPLKRRNVPNLAPIAAFPSIPADAPWPGQHNFAWAGGQLGFSAQAATVRQTTLLDKTGNVPSPMFLTDVAGTQCDALRCTNGPRTWLSVRCLGSCWGCV